MTNQKGYALLLVLGAVVIIGLLVPPMAYQIISSSTQASTTERDVQLENMYDMGKQVGRRHVEVAHQQLEEKGAGMSWDEAKEHFDDYFEEQYNSSVAINNLDYSNYSGDVEIEFEETAVDEENNILQVSYKVTPAVNGDRYDFVEETFYLRESDEEDVDNGERNDSTDWFESNGKIIDSLVSDSEEVRDVERSRFNPGQNVEMNRDVIFEEKLDVRANEENIIDGNVGLEQGMDTQGNNNTLTITGDLYAVNHNIEIWQESKLHVEGSSFFHNINISFRHENNRDEAYVCLNDIYLSGEVGITGAEENRFIPIDSCDQLNDEEFEYFEKRNVYYTGGLFFASGLLGLELEGTRGQY